MKTHENSENEKVIDDGNSPTKSESKHNVKIDKSLNGIDDQEVENNNRKQTNSTKGNSLEEKKEKAVDDSMVLDHIEQVINSVIAGSGEQIKSKVRTKKAKIKKKLKVKITDKQKQSQKKLNTLKVKITKKQKSKSSPTAKASKNKKGNNYRTEIVTLSQELEKFESVAETVIQKIISAPTEKLQSECIQNNNKEDIEEKGIVHMESTCSVTNTLPKNGEKIVDFKIEIVEGNDEMEISNETSNTVGKGDNSNTISHVIVEKNNELAVCEIKKEKQDYDEIENVERREEFCIEINPSYVEVDHHHDSIRQKEEFLVTKKEGIN
jgi:hypothetical protein